MNEAILPLLKPLLELGITGLMFIMWWMERRTKQEIEIERDKYRGLVVRTHEIAENLLVCVKENTASTTKLNLLLEQRKRPNG